MKITRRQAMSGAAAAAVAAPHVARAQAQKLNVFAHKVHHTVSTGSQGGNISEAFTKKTSVAVEWATFDTGPLQDRLLREVSLGETSVDVGFVLNTQATPKVAGLFEPLEPFLAKDGIEDPADLFGGAMKAFTVGGKLIGLPFRHASSGLHYNEVILAERGITSAPTTIEEFVEVAKKCAFNRNGTPVVGLVLDGASYPNVVDLARAWDGDFITPDLRVVANEPPMVQAVSLLRDLYVSGAFPRNFSVIKTEDVNVWMQTGRAAMAVNSLGRSSIYNDPAKSQFPGKFKTGNIPIAKALAGKFEVAPAKVEFWGMAIPKNSKNKNLAWSFMKHMLSKESTLAAALNGNGPVRASTYDDPKIIAKLPYAKAEQRVLKVARTPMPAFDNALRAADAFKEEAESAVLGIKTPQKAMDDLTERVKKLIG